MGVDVRRTSLVCVVSLLSAAAVAAAPRLKVEQPAVGPIAVAVGANGPTERITLKNLGDGTLGASASSNVDWLVPSIGQSYGCALFGICIPLDVQLNTANLAKGVYTGTITVSAPGALDSPQTTTITVAVGGNVPDQVNIYVPVGGTASQAFQTNSLLTTNVTAPSNGPSLAMAVTSTDNSGTTATYKLISTAPANATPGVYTGSLLVSNSTIAAENKTVPVTITVTNQPIASISSVPPFRIALGSAQQNPHYAVVTNAGSGTLTISNVASTTAGGGNWLTTSVYGPYIAVSANPAGLAAGHYTGSVTVTTNAANSQVTLPVSLDVVAPTAPWAYVGGVVDPATYTPYQPLAQGDLMTIFGEQLTAGPVFTAATLPLQTSVNGTTVYVNDVAVPIYYMSAEQINFQVPFDAKLGPGVLRVDRGGQRGNDVYIVIQASKPKLHVAVAANNPGVQLATALAPSLLPIQRGQDLVLYALGLGPTTPAVATGAASPSQPLAQVANKPSVAFGSGDVYRGGITVTPDFVGLTPTLVGLYQVNVKVPASAPTGKAVPVALAIPTESGTPQFISNSLQLTIQ